MLSVAAAVELSPQDLRQSRFDADPDTALMVEFARGNTTAFDLLVERHRGPVISHLYRIVRSPDTAEDLAQDVFIRVFRARSTYRPNAKFTTWLFHITTNVGLNWRRDTRRDAGQLSLHKELRSGRKLEVPDPSARADELLVRECFAKEIRGAIEALPPKQLAAVLLHKYEGMEYAEIAKVLGCSMQALKSLLFRAYETLRQRLAHLEQSARERYTCCPQIESLS